MKSNSQTQLSANFHLGDLDGDKIDEIIRIDGRHIYVYKPTYDFVPVFEYVFSSPIARVIIGDFTNGGREFGKDQICVILTDGSFQAFAISDDLKTLWWWFTQPNFISPEEHYIVGDFTGDGADDIMVYNPISGSIKIYSRMRNGYFENFPNFALGNLSGDNRNKIILAGDFGQAANRKDILVINPSNCQISRYDSVTDNSNVTFWWAFTTRSNFIQPNDQVRIANISGSIKDEVMIRKISNGEYRFFKAEFSDGGLIPISNVDIGQLPIKPNAGKILPAKIKDRSFRRERGGTRRDDVLYFEESTKELIRVDARFDSGSNKFTYWWAYTSYLLFEPVIPVRRMPWAVILCRFSGLPENPNIERDIRGMFTPGSGGLIEYWHDVSLGSIDISDSRVFGWVELDMRRENAGSPNGREQLVDAAIAACRRDRLDPTTGFHGQIAILTHDWAVDGVPAGLDYNHPTWGRFWIDGSSIGSKVSSPPREQSGSIIAHEMAHGMGFDHDLLPNLADHYGDPSCVMSADLVHAFVHPVWNTRFGPSLSFPQLMIHNIMYVRRVLTIDRSWIREISGTTFTLAPIQDRTADGNLGCILPSNSSSDWNYYLEYMRPKGWNTGIVNDKLLVRRIYLNKAVYLGEILLPSRMGLKAEWVESSGRVKFQIEKNQSDGRVIKVTASRV